MAKQEQKYLTVPEYAKKMGVKPIAIYKQMERGKLKFIYKYGRKLIKE